MKKEYLYMIDNVYKNSFKEVYDILQNTDEELVHKIPKIALHNGFIS